VSDAAEGDPGPGDAGPGDAGPPSQYTPDEQAALREAVAAGGAPACPRDGAVMTRRPVGGGSFGLGYARQRVWLLCPRCRRSALFDVRRGTRN
jgi:hypothetical protein